MKLVKRTPKRTIIKTVIISIIVLLCALISFFPFYWMILTSVKDPKIIGDTSLFTNQLTWDSYIKVFTYEDGIIWRAYLNSIIISGCATLGTLLTSSMAAYAFAKIKFKGGKPIYGIFIATLMIPGQVTMLPLFIMFANIGWVHNFLPLIIPCAMINTYGVFMLRSFIVSIPDGLLEAADIDGCGYFRKYFKIVLPMIKPALITLALFTFIGCWNNYMGSLIYLDASNPSQITIPLFIGSFNEMRKNPETWGMIMAASTLSIIPISIIYLKCQKYFVQGIATTGIK